MNVTVVNATVHPSRAYVLGRPVPLSAWNSLTVTVSDYEWYLRHLAPIQRDGHAPLALFSVKGVDLNDFITIRALDWFI